jgi:hypothetical protein
MSTAVYFTRAKLQQRLHQGPLDLYIDLYATRLLKEGHGCRSAAVVFTLLAISTTGLHESSLELAT